MVLCLSLVLPARSAAESADLKARGEEIAKVAQEEARPAAQQAGDGVSQAQPFSDEEAAALEARAEEPGPEVSGGALSNLHLTYVVIALSAIVLVLLIK